MLKQILRDMYVDPEILSGLDEIQKQTLFCKMREEQIRRWRIREQQYDKSPEAKTYVGKSPSKTGKNVSFREDDEGEPWVMIIGEPDNDDNSDDSDSSKKTYDDLQTKEAKLRARELAEIETIELRRQYKEAELNDIIIDYDSKKTIEDVDPLGSPIIDDLEIYCSVDELRERMNHSKASPSMAKNFKPNGNSILDNRIQNFNLTSSTEGNNGRNIVLKEISNNKPLHKVSAKIALWEQRVIGEKTNEIYQRLKKKQQEAAEEEAKKQDEAWKEQERRAKEADIQIREIARRAREEHRKSINETSSMQNNYNSQSQSSSNASSSPPSSLDSVIPRPPNQEALIEWYRNREFSKGCGLDAMTRLPSKWFHGLVTRLDAEQLLEMEPAGSFLVRLSEKIWGYAISYKDADRCKHYLIDASNGQYQFLGANQTNHTSLNDLIKHHATVPITSIGKELLLRPCLPLVPIPKIFDGLL